MSGPFGSSQWMYSSGDAGFYDFPISNSLRFNDDDSALLSRTPSSASNRDTWTWSAWVKRGNIGAAKGLFAAPEGTSGNTAYLDIIFTAADELAVSSYATLYRKTTRLFRDPSAWYHLVVAVDTTDGTADDRIKIYVNGVQETSFVTNNAKTQNEDTGINSAVVHEIGDGGNHFDGYMAEVNFVDGSQLTPSSFGETKNDIWIPKDTAGLTFGTNGFRLQFKQSGTGTASSSTIGADTSGNTNHWTSTNLVASDVVSDSPTNNFATINIFDDKILSPHFTYSEGNLKLAYNKAGVSFDRVFGSMAIPPNTTNKYYMEFTGNVNNEQLQFGIVSTDSLDYSLADRDNGLSGVANASSLRWASYESAPHLLRVDSSTDGGGSALTTSNGNAANGDIFSILYDGATGKFFAWFKGTEFTNQSYPNTSLWATMDTSKTYMVMIYQGDGGTSTKTGNVTVNFGQDSSFAGAHTAQGNTDANGIGDFYYNVPANALALCTSNLPDPVATIDPAQGGSSQDYFNTVLWTGNGSTQSITGVGFQPDFVWQKERSSGTIGWHNLIDSVRGAGKRLFSNVTNAESDAANNLTSFDSDGFSIGNDGDWNESDKPSVAWNWKAGTAFSNDASATGVGSIDSAGSVNTDVGFSIINYVGSGGNGTYAHGLGVTPEMVMVKDRTDTANWAVYHKAVGTGKYLELNQTDAVTTDSVQFPSVTSTVIGVGVQGDGSITNTDTDNYIAYCFASVDGYSKISSFIGNGNADGTFVYTGFRPAFIMMKQTAVDDWGIYDSKRLGQNNDGSAGNSVLYPNIANAEETQASRAIDLLSNGFKLRTSNVTFNENNGTYIYMAFAEQSFKYANGR